MLKLLIDYAHFIGRIIAAPFTRCNRHELVRTPEEAARMDYEALLADWAAVGDDMRAALGEWSRWFTGQNTAPRIDEESK